MSSFKYIAIAIVSIALMAMLIKGCQGSEASKAKAVRALEAYGFTNITIDNGNFPWGGSKEDTIRYDAVVTNPLGKRVKVSVYLGFWKDATVRTR